MTDETPYGVRNYIIQLEGALNRLRAENDALRKELGEVNVDLVEMTADRNGHKAMARQLLKRITEIGNVSTQSDSGFGGSGGDPVAGQRLHPHGCQDKADP